MGYSEGEWGEHTQKNEHFSPAQPYAPMKGV